MPEPLPSTQQQTQVRLSYAQVAQHLKEQQLKEKEHQHQEGGKTASVAGVEKENNGSQAAAAAGAASVAAAGSASTAVSSGAAVATHQKKRDSQAISRLSTSSQHSNDGFREQRADARNANANAARSASAKDIRPAAGAAATATSGATTATGHRGEANNNNSLKAPNAASTRTARPHQLKDYVHPAQPQQGPRSPK